VNENAIFTQNLSRDFATVRAVDNVNLIVPRGILFGFLGPNGAGKTTMLRLLLGLLEPSSGEAYVLGYNSLTQADEIRRQCGALLEHTGLYERLSAENNLDLFGRIWHMPRPERQARSKELLVHLQLWERRKEAVGQWSRGMKQKLAIARTLFHRPQLIFLDEPTVGLDPVAALALRNDLVALAEREGVTVFLTTHNLAEAEKVCQQVGVIRGGQLLAVGAPQELRERQRGARLEMVGHGFTDEVMSALQERPEVAAIKRVQRGLSLTLRDEASSAPLVNLAVSMGAAVEEVRRENATLEEVFVTLMQEES
jgi:ABC-2 type transport system ATP-binding protein